jgi:hypothetical protein
MLKFLLTELEIASKNVYFDCNEFIITQEACGRNAVGSPVHLEATLFDR